MVKHHVLSNRAVHTYEAMIAVLLLSSIAHGGGRLFVDDDAPLGGDGISWDSAYRFLADALVAAGKGQVDEIRVAQGVYKPDRDEANPDGTGDREATFQLINGLALMGGYAGIGAKDPDARDIELYETILSGDLLGNDEPEFMNNDENSYHVVRGNAIDETAVFDGFSITAGNADGSGDQRSGGGMFNTTSASPTVTSCTFVANSADLGGGGMCNIEESSPTVIDCTFNGNLAGSPVATGSTSENANTPAGGGMYNSEDSSPTVIGCTFVANAAAYGGGMTNAENSSPTVIGCTFSDNSGADGGGMLNVFSSNPAVTDCIFSGNSASWRGGGMYNFGDCNPTVTNCTFSDNSAGDGGGGMLNFFYSNPTVTNCTFSGNWAEEGGGISGGDRGTAVTNCIVWGNANEQISGVEITVRYSCVEGGYEGTGNIDADPLFVAPGSGDYRLSAGSPCIDAANNWGVPVDVHDYDADGITNELFPVDLDGNPRFNADESDFDPGCGVPVVVDMGAYEYQFDPVEDVIFADLDGDGSVGVVDLLRLLGGWGPCAQGCCLADLDLDGSIGYVDLSLLLANWD